MRQKNESYIITKRIAKHGTQAVIVIPSVLHGKLRPKTLVRVTIDLIEENISEGMEAKK